jgi:hypothetical protein
MADVCVIYTKRDETIVRKLVALLREHWSVWWAGDINHGNWERRARTEINNSRAVVPVLSKHTINQDILTDEMNYAKKKGRLIFPFLLDNMAEVPLGFGQLNHTEAFDWTGSEKDPGYRKLSQKIGYELKAMIRGSGVERTKELTIHGKMLQLPCFVFSLSSHETQVTPVGGLELFQLLNPSACLVSAYDVWKIANHRKNNKRLEVGQSKKRLIQTKHTVLKTTRNQPIINHINRLCSSESIVFLDSGNYEAYRKNDYYSKYNKEGWQNKYFRTIVDILSPDVIFAFDKHNPKGHVDRIAKRIISDFNADKTFLASKDCVLCPIIHLPEKNAKTPAENASAIACIVASEVNPSLLAIPERELGDGLLERVKSVRDIRHALNGLGRYYPLHILGTGNPITMLALAAAGADLFDGLEWCRTVVDYDKGTLFHFQHFDCFRELYHSRLRPAIRAVIDNPNASYNAQVACYNFDYFTDCTKTMQRMISAGLVEDLLRTIPNIGTKLYEELTK